LKGENEVPIFPLKYLGVIMPAIEPLTSMLGLKASKFSQIELVLLEIEILTLVCEEIKKMMQSDYHDYFHYLKYSADKEKNMLEENVLRYVINDIISSEQYSLAGIAYYTHTPIEVINDVAMGNNTMPSFSLSRKIIDLHRSVRPDLYQEIIQKLVTTDVNEEYWH
jgi:hypothetical protein